MWTASMLATAGSVVTQLMDSHHKIFQDSMFLIVAIAFGGYQANIIQFGLDQLQDASTTEITAFIRWYVWTYISSRAIFQFTHTCLNDIYHTLGQIVICIAKPYNSDQFILHNQFVSSTGTSDTNPFKLIYKVIRYAIKHKHPRCRSAFTYCEDELPSRIDFGKSKINMEDHSQQSRWKMSKHFYDCWLSLLL